MIMSKKKKAEQPVPDDILYYMEHAGTCQACGFEVYRYQHPGRKIKWVSNEVTCYNCNKRYAVCGKCGKITKVEWWMFLTEILCVECSKPLDRDAAEKYFKITESDHYYVSLDNLDGQWAHLGYND